MYEPIVDARAVVYLACGACGARPLSPCTMAGGTSAVDPHVSRYRAWEELEEEAQKVIWTVAAAPGEREEMLARGWIFEMTADAQQMFRDLISKPELNDPDAVRKWLDV